MVSRSLSQPCVEGHRRQRLLIVQKLDSFIPGALAFVGIVSHDWSHLDPSVVSELPELLLDVRDQGLGVLSRLVQVFSNFLGRYWFAHLESIKFVVL